MRSFKDNAFSDHIFGKEESKLSQYFKISNQAINMFVSYGNFKLQLYSLIREMPSIKLKNTENSHQNTFKYNSLTFTLFS